MNIPRDQFYELMYSGYDDDLDEHVHNLSVNPSSLFGIILNIISMLQQIGTGDANEMVAAMERTKH